MKRLVCALTILFLAACASGPKQPGIAEETARPSIYDDAAFAPPSVVIDPADIFALSPEMRSFLDTKIARRVTTDGKVSALVESLFDKRGLKFSYNTSETGNAAGVFASRSGNCLSYTIMTAAFAKEMQIPVQFHARMYADVWDRNDNTDFLIGHVNLTLGHSVHQNGDQQERLVDFTALNEARGQLLEDIGEDVIVAMYMNNRAAEALVRGKIDDAYWWARAATQASPSFITAYNTLGVIYMNHHQPAMASRVLERVLEREPENVTALNNESLALSAQGRASEAVAIKAHLTQIQPTPPFYYFTLGVRAMQEKDYKTAKAEFTKEVARASYNHKFHFWLALADYNLGEFDETRRQLTFAMENSPNDQQHDLYAAKLAALRQKEEIN